MSANKGNECTSAALLRVALSSKADGDGRGAGWVPCDGICSCICVILVSDFFEFFDRTSVKFYDAPIGHHRLTLHNKHRGHTHPARLLQGFCETGDKRVLQSEALGIAIGSPYYENCNILWLI